MENLKLSFEIIFPLFLMLALGYGIKRIRLFDNKTIDTMNDVSFKVFLPVLLFYNIYKTDVQTAFNPKLITFTVISLVVIFLLLCFIIPLLEKDNKKRGVLIQGIFRSNFVIFGLPISIALCGADNVGATSILIAIVVPIYNALSVVILEIYRGEGIHIKRILKGIVTNPLIIAAALGVMMMLIKVPLPGVIETGLSDVAKIATPLSLILLGASFKFSDMKGYAKQLCIGVFGKLLIVPAIFIPICVLMGFRGAELAALVVMIGAPTAVSTYTIAGQMEADQTLAGQLVVFDSIGSIFTMFLWIFILKQLALF